MGKTHATIIHYSEIASLFFFIVQENFCSTLLLVRKRVDSRDVELRKIKWQNHENCCAGVHTEKQGALKREYKIIAVWFDGM